MFKKNGQTLVEMIVIIGIVVVMATGIIAGSSVSFSRTQDDKLRSEALGLAQEAVELTRQKRDEGWNAFSVMGIPKTVYCMDSGKIFVEGACVTYDLNSRFMRNITLEMLNQGDLVNEKMSVDVTVLWQKSDAADNMVSLQTILTQWK